MQGLVRLAVTMRFYEGSADSAGSEGSMGSTGKVLRCAPFFMRTSHIPAPSFGRGRRAQRDGVGFALVRRTGAFSSLPLTIHKNCSEAIIFQPPPWKEG